MADKEPEWIEHDGSAVCPVPAGHVVEVRFFSGTVTRDREPESFDWSHTSSKYDITHYRDWTAFKQQQQQQQQQQQAKPAPRLLTEADVKRLHGMGYHEWPQVLSELRERGLIAAEPVDPLLVEAREIVAEWNRPKAPKYAEETLAGFHDNAGTVICAIAALKRGIDLARANGGEGK